MNIHAIDSKNPLLRNKLLSAGGETPVFNTVVGAESGSLTLLTPTETKLVPFYIDSMRAICLLRNTLEASQAQKRGFSNFTSGKEELEFRMRNALYLSVTSRTTTKNSKTVDSASLDRQQVVPMKCESPVSPSPVLQYCSQAALPPALETHHANRDPDQRSDPSTVEGT